MVPQTTGRAEIPPLPFSYFDPQAGKIVSTADAAASRVRVEGGTLAAGLPAPPPTQAAAGARLAAALPLRSDLDRPPRRALSLSGRALLACSPALVLLLHAGLWGGGRVRGGRRPGPRGSAALALGPRRARASSSAPVTPRLSKEQAAALVEKAPARGVRRARRARTTASARGRVRALLDDVRFVRYAPQLGDYSDKIRDLAARAAETVRRWA